MTAPEERDLSIYSKDKVLSNGQILCRFRDRPQDDPLYPRFQCRIEPARSLRVCSPVRDRQRTSPYTPNSSMSRQKLSSWVPTYFADALNFFLICKYDFFMPGGMFSTI
jgi:hypothetical protein